MRKNLQGIITPIITPLHEDFSLDEQSLERLIDHIIAGGVHGIFVLGTTGEFASLSMDLKLQLLQKTKEFTAGRVPVMAGISSSVLRESESLAKYAQELEYDAVVATPPYYMRINQQEIYNYYETLTQCTDLPLYVYNMPGLTKTSIDFETVVRLSENPKIVGFKDSSGDLGYFGQVSEYFRNTDFEVFIGPEEKLREALQKGGDGGVNGGSNIFPTWYTSLVAAHQKGDIEETDRLQNQILDFSDQVYSADNDPNSYLKGLKAAMWLKGLCKNVLAPPFQAYTGEKLELISERLKAF